MSGEYFFVLSIKQWSFLIKCAWKRNKNRDIYLLFSLQQQTFFIQKTVSFRKHVAFAHFLYINLPYLNTHRETRNSYGIPKALNAANFHCMRAPLRQFYSTKGVEHTVTTIPQIPTSLFTYICIYNNRISIFIRTCSEKVSFYWCMALMRKNNPPSRCLPPLLLRRRGIARSLIAASATTTTSASHVLYAVGGWFAVVPIPVWRLDRKWWRFRDGIRESSVGVVI